MSKLMEIFKNNTGGSGEGRGREGPEGWVSEPQSKQDKNAEDSGM